jgi:hypothetical protein
MREKETPKTDKQLRDEFCKIYDKDWIGIPECIKDVDDER